MLILTYGLLWANNNLGANNINEEEINRSLESSIQWMVDNQRKVLDANNPMLWWKVMRAAKLTGDTRLARLFEDYKRRYLKRQYHSAWNILFDQNRYAIINPDSIGTLPDYNQYIIYGLSCSRQLVHTEIIQRQMRTDFCREYHPISPACVTHQMMGLNFRLLRGCGEREELTSQMRVLQDKVVQQLTWDPRVVDVYLQRVLMLIDTGAEQRLHQRWLQRVLKAQLPDGSWSAFAPLVPLPSGKAVGFNARGVTVSAAIGDYHATAQGMLIMSLLSQSLAGK